jgi:hypothetical protein
MFRPYNLTSLLAWTAGSLAGNQAYYGTKIKQARDKENTSPYSAQFAKEYKPDLWNYYETLVARLYQNLEKAIELQPDLWEKVVNEYKQKKSQIPSLGIKLATWELMELSPHTKIY